jgi:ABC-type transport system involved in multi-copper enzyme maturation permease subunit
MAFLPIAERELRIASRRKSTHRVRVWTTLAGLLVSLFFIIFQRVLGRAMGNLGPVLFGLLTYYAFGLALLAGVVLAADSISVEKREGTLGLLFLTDLKGYDVVFGKLAAVGLSALCGLVAVLPVTGLPVLMGGVTGAEFGRVALALVNTLFFALATGILVSTWSRESAWAMAWTLGILALVAVAIPAVGKVMMFIRLPPGWWYMTSFSPFNSFNFGSETKYWSAPGRYWYSLLSSHLTAWCMLFLASWILPRAWQDKPFRQRRSAFAASVYMGSKSGAAMREFNLRSRLLDLNPIAWLAEKSSGMSRRFWMIFAIGAGVVALILLVDRNVWTFIATSYVMFALILGMKIMVAFQACRFFAEARRSGAWEMILSTPLTARQIIAGQWLAIRRIFLWPAIVLFTAQLVLSLLAANSTNQMIKYNFSSSSGRVPPVLLAFFATKWPLVFAQAAGIFYQTIKAVGQMLALGWMGMWFGLSAKKPSLAVGWTILFGLVIPAVICIPDPIIDLVLCLWARNKLQLELRRVIRPQGLVPLWVSPFAPPPIIR